MRVVGCGRDGCDGRDEGLSEVRYRGDGRDVPGRGLGVDCSMNGLRRRCEGMERMGW